MDRLSLLADEHVPRIFVSALHSSGYTVVLAQAEYGAGTDDEALLSECRDCGLVVLTNDRDFLRLAGEREHAGVLVYNDRNRLLDEPLAAVRGVDRINESYGAAGLRNTVEWLDGWV